MECRKFNAIVLENTSGIGNAGFRHVQALAAVTRVNISLVHQPDINIYGNNYVHAGPRATKRVIDKYGEGKFREGYNIAFWVHESSELRPEFFRWVDCYNEVWVPSKYCYEIFSSQLNVPIKIVPHCITQYGLVQEVGDPFTFLHCYSGGSHIIRKGTIDAIEGFKKAFGKKKTVKLKIKLRNVQQSIEEWLESLCEGYNIEFVKGDFSQDKLDELYGSVDCGVFPFKSEGFGLQPLELMGFGKPSIVTKGSGCDDFCVTKNSFKIDSNLGPTNDDLFPGEWFYPEMDGLVSCYRMAVEGAASMKNDCFETALDYSLTRTINATWMTIKK